jgi:hypothetical protein
MKECDWLDYCTAEETVKEITWLVNLMLRVDRVGFGVTRSRPSRADEFSYNIDSM